MSSFALKFPRVLNASGSAGPRRLLLLGGTAIAIVSGVAIVALRGNSSDPAPMIAKAPRVDPLPGGPHGTPAYTTLAVASDQDKAAKASAAGQSSVASMPGSETAVRIPPAPPEVATVTPPQVVQPTTTVTPRPVVSRPVSSETGVTADAAPARTLRVAATPAPPVVPTNVAQQQQRPDDQSRAYQAAMSSLLTGWGSNKPQLTEVILKPEDEQHSADPGQADPISRSPGVRRGPAQDGYSQPPIPNAPRLQQGRNAGQVLMPAGRGIYARTVLAASSDQGGPVVVEALSGPIAGDRMTGSFERRDERLVIKLDSITLQDGTQQSINALVVSPDTLETSVASSVDEHYLSRFVLPVAAAFVSGLGQAIGQSNSTVTASPFGGATAFQKLGIGQELGVAAGVGAAQFGAAVRESAPRGPTVKVDAGANVGVMFLTPLTVGGDR